MESFVKEQLLIKEQRANKQIANWLLVGVGMLVIQVLLGGITRLTESGLSITEWKPITGILPPMNDTAWQAEFDKYKGTDQFKYVHQHFSLSDFKFIFFWEWFHRVWARLMAVVFVIGFIYFLLSRKFRQSMIVPMVILFVLGAMQGLIGWIMVSSGLVPEKYFVGHVELATHFVAAMGLIAYVLWFAMKLLLKPAQIVVNAAWKNLVTIILCLLIVQLAYGAFMAGMKAGASAPTWPDINGKMIPDMTGDMQPAIKNIVYNPIAVHFIHRSIAYIIFILSLVWLFRSKAIENNRLFNRLRSGFVWIVSLQVLLGILTVLNAGFPSRLVWLGVAHQFTAMLLLMLLTALMYVVRRR